MINYLKLTNFRQHKDRQFTFKDGLVVMRGANEAGKSTILSALMYLWFGSKVLNEPLSDVVSYGEPEKSLRVEGSFTIDGVVYSGYRSPTGAELVYGDQRVTGQTAVTQFVERLLGAKADIVRKLMVAEQNSVRGILDSGAEAGALIESLAELDIVDTYIDKIKMQLSCGPTKGAEAALGALQSAVQVAPVKPVANFKHEEDELALAETALGTAHANLKGAEQEAADAQQVLFTAAQTAKDREKALKRADDLNAVQMPKGVPYTDEAIQAARDVESNAAKAKEAEAAKAVAFKTTEGSFDGTVEEANAFLATQRKLERETAENISSLKVQRATKLATKINDGVCSFCKKDISELPEVATTNAAVDKQVQTIDEAIAEATKTLAKTRSDIAVLTEILEVDRANKAKANSAYWQAVAGQLPAKFLWVGPEVQSSEALAVSSAGMVKHNSLLATQKLQWEAAQRELASLIVPELVPEQTLDFAKRAIQGLEASKRNYSTVLETVNSCKVELATAKATFNAKLSAYEAELARYESATSEVEKAQKLLEDMQFNNQLIDDLRSARSELRRKMWNIVTSAISVYFSRVRQVETRITQSEDGFLQNGKSVKGLSGSAKDALGLAIRAALLKTFIPGAPILVVDEPFSACDDTREVAGISVLQGLGFPQTVLVTHSDLADSVANQLIQL